jgi:hypothetical protein
MDSQHKQDTLAPPAPVVRSIVYNNVAIDKNQERLVRMAQVFGKFASTLTLRRIRVELLNGRYMSGIPEAPAWSDSDSITFRTDLLKQLDTPKGVTGLKGLSLHEICHILLTPRDGTVLVKKVRGAKVWQAYNALEDMRIEMFLHTRYSNVKDWLTATIAQYLLDNPKQVKYQFPLVYGRKYLPVDIRTMVRDEYQHPKDIAELEQLIDKYIVLNLADPANYNKAFDIIKRYHDIIGKQMNDQSSGDGCESGEGCGDHSNHKTGWESTSNPNGHDTRKNAEWKPGSKSLTKQQQEAIAKRISTANGEGYEAGDSDPNAPLTRGGGGAGAGSGGEKVREALEDLLQDIYQRKHEEIVDTIRQLNGEAKLNDKQVSIPARSQWIQQLSVDPEVVSASRSFANELERIKGDNDPGWDRRVDSGRLNVGRYVTGAEVDECFDQWEMGREDAVDIEAVILLDTSGSMDWALKSSFQSMWAIKRALDKINASTTVLTFGSNAELLYSADERASTTMKYTGDGGGTEPKQAVDYAYSVLANSTRAVKVFIPITDGMWYNSENTDNKIRQLRKAGVLTALAYVLDPRSLKLDEANDVKIDSHGCEIATNITNPRDLFTLARKLVKVGVARNLA